MSTTCFCVLRASLIARTRVVERDGGAKKSIFGPEAMVVGVIVEPDAALMRELWG